jgi:hypothetical protein
MITAARSSYEYSRNAAFTPGDEAGPWSWMQLDALGNQAAGFRTIQVLPQRPAGASGAS